MLGLLSKLKHYGIDDKIWTWIFNFLKRVVVDGIRSDLVTVDSGVRQGTVLGPILFLLHINDLPSVISSKVRLFADDCLVYRKIKSRQDQNDLQKDINLLESWGTTWRMRFNAANIHVWKRLMCVPGKNILKSSATSVTTLTHMDNRSFLTVLVRGMALQPRLLKTLQRPTL